MNTTERKPVDAPAVLDQATRECRDAGLQAQLHDAFAAVAELIEADKEYDAAKAAMDDARRTLRAALPHMHPAAFRYRNAKSRRAAALARVQGGACMQVVAAGEKA